MPVDLMQECGESAVGELLERAAAVLLEACAIADAELGVRLTDDEEIRRLNAAWRGKDKATDVLSFPQIDEEDDDAMAAAADEGSDGRPPAMLGDVVISMDTAGRQATAGGWTVGEESVRLLLHGLLHLLGFDHETGDADAARMRDEELRLVAVLAAAGIDCAAEVDP
jgi:probable rRNA maturation factor